MKYGHEDCEYVQEKEWGPGPKTKGEDTHLPLVISCSVALQIS